jgi:hypothetical protein
MQAKEKYLTQTGDSSDYPGLLGQLISKRPTPIQADQPS